MLRKVRRETKMSATPETTTGNTLYDQIGGAAAVDAAVDIFYEKVLGDVGGKLAHTMLHTHYHGRKRITEEPLTIRNTEHPKIDVSVCIGTNCFVKGSQTILKKLMNYVVDNRLEDMIGFEGQDEMVDVKATFCFEKCNKGPVVKVNNIIIEKATYEKSLEILTKEIHRIGDLINS